MKINLVKKQCISNQGISLLHSELPILVPTIARKLNVLKTWYCPYHKLLKRIQPQSWDFPTDRYKVRHAQAKRVNTKTSTRILCLLAGPFKPGWSRREAEETQCTGACLPPCPWVPGPEGSILLIKSILCSRTYNDSIDPSINSQQSQATESPPPSCLLYPWLDQPTFSPVTLIYSPDKHNLIMHTISAHCTFYTFCLQDLFFYS